MPDPAQPNVAALVAIAKGRRRTYDTDRTFRMMADALERLEAERARLAEVADAASDYIRNGGMARFDRWQRSLTPAPPEEPT